MTDSGTNTISQHGDQEDGVRAQTRRYAAGRFTDDERRRGVVRSPAAVSGTSWYRDVVEAPRDRVYEVLGAPTWQASEDDYLQDDVRTTVSWDMMLTDGTVFEVYDDRGGYGPRNERLTLNVGARSAADSAKVVAFLCARGFNRY